MRPLSRSANPSRCRGSPPPTGDTSLPSPPPFRWNFCRNPIRDERRQLALVPAEAVIGVAHDDDLAALADMLRQKSGIRPELVVLAVDVERRLANGAKETERPAAA